MAGEQVPETAALFEQLRAEAGEEAAGEALSMDDAVRSALAECERKPAPLSG